MPVGDTTPLRVVRNQGGERLWVSFVECVSRCPKLIDHAETTYPWYGFVSGNTDAPCPTVIDPTPPGGTIALTT